MSKFWIRHLRQWALAGLVGGSVTLGAVTQLQADDEKPRQERKEGERKAPPKEGEPRRDGDRKAPPKEGDRPDAHQEEIARLKKAIAEAAAKGNFEDVTKMTQRLEELLKGWPPPRRDGDRPLGERDRPRDLPPEGNPDLMRRLQEEMLRTMKSFEETIQKLQGQPEAQEAVRKAMDAYRQAMEMNLPRGRMDFGFGGIGRVGDPFGRGLLGNPVPRGGSLGVAFLPPADYLYDVLDLPKGIGMIVQAVMPNSPADKAGFKRNDLLLMLGGEEVSSEPAKFLTQVERLLKQGKPVEAVVLRKGKKETIKGIEAPKEQPRGELDRGREGRVNFTSMSFSVNNGEFMIQAATKDGKYVLTGEKSGDEPRVNSIKISSGTETNEYKSLRDVPPEHQPAVRQLLGTVR